MAPLPQDAGSATPSGHHDAEKSPGEPAENLPSDALAFPEGGARAWAVAAGAAGVLFCTLGYVNSFGVYQEYYQSHQLRDQSPSRISWIGSLQAFFLFAGALFGGPLFDRFGAKVIWPPAATFVFSLMMTSVCKSYYQFVLAQGVLGGLSSGMLMSPAMAAVPQYFQQNRGAAMGLAVAGSSLGGVVFPIALAKMFAHPALGFGWSVRICGFLVLGILVVSCAGTRARLPPRESQFFLLSAFRERHYLTLIGAVFLALLGVFTPIFYLPTYAVEHGMNPDLASYLIAILNAASFFGRVLPGILADRLGRLNVFWAAGLATGILIFCWQAITTNASIIVFSALFGFCSGAIISGIPVCFANCPQDPRNIGTYMGMGMAIASLATLVGPPINGALLTHYKSYDQISTFSGAVVLAGSMVVLLAKHFTGQGAFAKV